MDINPSVRGSSARLAPWPQLPPWGPSCTPLSANSSLEGLWGLGRRLLCLFPSCGLNVGRSDYRSPPIATSPAYHLPERVRSPSAAARACDEARLGSRAGMSLPPGHRTPLATVSPPKPQAPPPAAEGLRCTARHATPRQVVCCSSCPVHLKGQ